MDAEPLMTIAELLQLRYTFRMVSNRHDKKKRNRGDWG